MYMLLNLNLNFHQRTDSFFQDGTENRGQATGEVEIWWRYMEKNMEEATTSAEKNFHLQDGHSSLPYQYGSMGISCSFIFYNYFLTLLIQRRIKQGINLQNLEHKGTWKQGRSLRIRVFSENRKIPLCCLPSLPTECPHPSGGRTIRRYPLRTANGWWENFSSFLEQLWVEI